MPVSVTCHSDKFRPLSVERCCGYTNPRAPKATALRAEEYDVRPWIDPYGISNVNGLITIESFLRGMIFANDTFRPSQRSKLHLEDGGGGGDGGPLVVRT